MSNLYKIQMRDDIDSPWRDLSPLKGMYDHHSHTYAEARGIVADYKGLSKSKNFRAVKQRESRTDMLKIIAERKAMQKAETPHITHRTLGNSSGIQQNVYRIEIAIMGEFFWLKGSESPVRCDKQLSLVYKILNHLNGGNLLNMDYWVAV